MNVRNSNCRFTACHRNAGNTTKENKNKILLKYDTVEIFWKDHYTSQKHKEIKCRIKSENFCYCSVHTYLPCRVLFETKLNRYRFIYIYIYIYIYTHIFFPLCNWVSHKEEKTDDETLAQ
jgi:hypothetical protein